MTVRLLLLLYICLLSWGFSNVYHSACVRPRALKLGCVTNFDIIFLVMGFISLVDEIKFMLITSPLPPKTPQDSNDRIFPQGTTWEHILTDVPFVSISVGCKQRIWGIAENGTAYFRAGFGKNKTTGE